MDVRIYSNDLLGLATNDSSLFSFARPPLRLFGFFVVSSSFLHITLTINTVM